MGGGRRPVARARARGPARGRRLGHAPHDLGQSQRVNVDDRRQGKRFDPRQSGAGSGKDRGVCVSWGVMQNLQRGLINVVRL